MNKNTKTIKIYLKKSKQNLKSKQCKETLKVIKEVTGKIKSFDQPSPHKITMNNTKIFQKEKISTTTLLM